MMWCGYASGRPPVARQGRRPGLSVQIISLVVAVLTVVAAAVLRRERLLSEVRIGRRSPKSASVDYCKLRPMEPTRLAYQSRAVRAARASTPGVKAEGELVKHPRKLHREAKAKMRQLQRTRYWNKSEEDHRKWEEEVRAVQELQTKADEARMAFGFPFVDSNGVWQLVRTKTPASIFEEVLSRTLFELGLEKEEVDNVVQSKRGGGAAARPVPRRRAPPRPARPAGTWRGQQGHSWGSSVAVA